MSKRKVRKVTSQEEGHEAHIIATAGGHPIREPLVVQFSEYRERTGVSLRFHYVNNAGHLAPGRRGVRFPIPMIDDVIEALQKIKEELEGIGEATEEIPW